MNESFSLQKRNKDQGQEELSSSKVMRMTEEECVSIYLPSRMGGRKTEGKRVSGGLMVGNFFNIEKLKYCLGRVLVMAIIIMIMISSYLAQAAS